MRQILVLLLLLPMVVAAAEFRSIDLQHRSAEELLPILQPMVDSDTALTGTDYTLFIRGNPENLRELEKMVTKLDKAAQTLLITVAQGSSATGSGTDASLSGNQDQANVRLYSTQRGDQNTTSQRLQVMEGNWATIRAGEAVPQVTRRYHHGGSVEQRIEYRDVESGFEVRPRLNGDRVILDVRPFSASPAARGGGVIEQQQIVTRVSGNLGEWIELGGVTEKQSGEESGTIYSTRKRDQKTQNVRIKVELVGR